MRRDGAPLKGNTGVFVAGVFVPDSEAFELEGVKRLGPSDSLLDSMCPLIVARDGNAVLASTRRGRGVSGETLDPANVLVFGTDVQAAVGLPDSLPSERTGSKSVAQVRERTFDATVLE